MQASKYTDENGYARSVLHDYSSLEGQKLLLMVLRLSSISAAETSRVVGASLPTSGLSAALFFPCGFELDLRQEALQKEKRLSVPSTSGSRIQQKTR